MVDEGSKFYRHHKGPSVRVCRPHTSLCEHCIKHLYLWQIACTNLPIPKGWIAWLATAHMYEHNLLGLRVITRINRKAPAKIETTATGPRPGLMPTNQPHRTSRPKKQISKSGKCEWVSRNLTSGTLCISDWWPCHWIAKASLSDENIINNVKCDPLCSAL